VNGLKKEVRAKKKEKFIQQIKACAEQEFLNLNESGFRVEFGSHFEFFGLATIFLIFFTPHSEKNPIIFQ
jgi:hypothetical protein